MHYLLAACGIMPMTSSGPTIHGAREPENPDLFTLRIGFRISLRALETQAHLCTPLEDPRIKLLPVSAILTKFFAWGQNVR